MRDEEKQVDGPDLEREQDKETLIEEEEEERLPEAGEQVRDLGQERAGALLGAMRMILEQQQVTVNSLHLPQREARALEALQAAVSGRSQTDQFVYAEDRRSLFEQALAVLQPNLAGADRTQLAVLHEHMSKLTRRVAEVRDQLENLQDAQEELLAHEVRANKAAAADTADKPKPAPPSADPDAPKPASSLDGPAREEPARPASSLGDPAEIREAQQQLPWWRRPAG